MPEVKLHPVQVNRGRGRMPQAVTLSAYEVYSHVFGKQEALITGGCRGGFGVGELIAFLYAKPFPKSEWRDRVNEALAGMNLGS
jgi:hypothetical protein